MVKKQISVLVLTLFITGSIDSIRNLPATALFGPVLIFFCLFGALVFLLPIALLSGELAAKFPTKGGIYHWSKMAFGQHMAFLAVWLQWINTMVWYPTILSFIAGTLAYLINPHLVYNKAYLITIILIVFWAQTLINLRGLHISARFAATCAVIGMFLPMALILILGIVWLCLGDHSAIQLHANNLLPHFGHSQSWISLTAIVTAFLGMELAAVHINEVKTPQSSFPKALLSSVFIILATMIFGSLVIAVVLPKAQISLVGGVMQAFSEFFKVYHLRWAVPVLALMVFVGSVGHMINWILSPAKGLLQAAQDGFLPKWMQKENKAGVPGNLLIVQAVLVSVLCLAFFLMPSVNGSYWLLTDLSTELYLLMYFILFISAGVLAFKFAHVKSTFKIPGGKYGALFVCLLGIFGVIVAFIVGFIPPGNINVGGFMHYEILFCLGIIVMIAPVLLFYGWRVLDSGSSPE